MVRKHKPEEPEAELPDSKNEAELKVKTVLEQLVSQGLILGFIHSKPNGQIDADGMDFLLKLKGGLLLPIQVKERNCGTRCKKVVEMHFGRHPLVLFILFVNIKKKNHVWTLEKKIRRFIRKASVNTAAHYHQRVGITTE